MQRVYAFVHFEMSHAGRQAAYNAVNVMADITCEDIRFSSQLSRNFLKMEERCTALTMAQSAMYGSPVSMMVFPPGGYQQPPQLSGIGYSSQYMYSGGSSEGIPPQYQQQVSHNCTVLFISAVSPLCSTMGLGVVEVDMRTLPAWISPGVTRMPPSRCILNGHRPSHTSGPAPLMFSMRIISLRWVLGHTSRPQITCAPLPLRPLIQGEAPRVTALAGLRTIATRRPLLLPSR